MTHLDISIRLEKHNLHLYGSSFTSKADDWEVFLLIECSSISQALLIEKHIKAMKSKIYIENLKKYPEMIQNLLDKYSGN